MQNRAPCLLIHCETIGDEIMSEKSTPQTTRRRHTHEDDMESRRRRWRVKPRVYISLSRSGSTTAAGDARAPVPNAAAERRRRVYALLDAANPARGRAVRWCESALGMLRSDGDMREARLLLRAALACGVHHPTVYRAWTAMEADHAGDAAAARALFEEWRARLDGRDDDDDDDAGGFWCRYIAFELANGGAARARAVAELAVAACPRDPAVHARYAKAELRLGRADRARAVLARALDCCLVDDGDREWLVDEVRRYSGYLRKRRRFRRLCGFIPRLFRGGCWSRPPWGYERLDGETL